MFAITPTILLFATALISPVTSRRDLWGPKNITMCEHTGDGPNGDYCEYSCWGECDKPEPEEGRDEMIKNFARARIDCWPSHKHWIPTLLCNRTQVGDCAWFDFKCMQFDDSTEEEAYWDRMHPDSESDRKEYGLDSDVEIGEDEEEENWWRTPPSYLRGRAEQA